MAAESSTSVRSILIPDLAQIQAALAQVDAISEDLKQAMFPRYWTAEDRNDAQLIAGAALRWWKRIVDEEHPLTPSLIRSFLMLREQIRVQLARNWWLRGTPYSFDSFDAFEYEEKLLKPIYDLFDKSLFPKVPHTNSCLPVKKGEGFFTVAADYLLSDRSSSLVIHLLEQMDLFFKGPLDKENYIQAALETIQSNYLNIVDFIATFPIKASSSETSDVTRKCFDWTGRLFLFLILIDPTNFSQKMADIFGAFDIKISPAILPLYFPKLFAETSKEQLLTFFKDLIPEGSFYESLSQIFSFERLFYMEINELAPMQDGFLRDAIISILFEHKPVGQKVDLRLFCLSRLPQEIKVLEKEKYDEIYERLQQATTVEETKHLLTYQYSTPILLFLRVAATKKDRKLEVRLMMAFVELLSAEDFYILLGSLTYTRSCSYFLLDLQYYKLIHGFRDKRDLQWRLKKLIDTAPEFRQIYFKLAHLHFSNLTAEQLRCFQQKNIEAEEFDRTEKANIPWCSSDMIGDIAAVDMTLYETAWLAAIRRFGAILDLDEQQLRGYGECSYSWLRHKSEEECSRFHSELNKRIEMDHDARALWMDQVRRQPAATSKEIALAVCQRYLDADLVSGGPLARLLSDVTTIPVFFARKNQSPSSQVFMTEIRDYLNANQHQPYDELLMELSYRMMTRTEFDLAGRAASILRIVMRAFVHELRASPSLAAAPTEPSFSSIISVLMPTGSS
jgi:hypothetical protein